MQIEQTQEFENFKQQKGDIKKIIDISLSLIEQDMKKNISNSLKENIYEAIILATEKCCDQAVSDYKQSINPLNS